MTAGVRAGAASGAWPSVLIVGSGFGGLGMAIKLKEAGCTELTVLEKAQSVGGTWRDNRYPGAACDVQSHLYSFSFEPKHDWSRKFGRQEEIRAYLEHCADKYGLKPHLRFGVEVSSADFDEAAGVWRVQAADGEVFTAQVLVTATGQLNRPAVPNLPGLADFRGPVMHSARWDPAVDLAGKRVAVIGTGASAIQFVPQIVGAVQRLHLFQRSAPWVLPKDDRPFTPREQGFFRRWHWWDRLYRALIYWRNELRALGFTNVLGLGFALKVFEWMALRHLAAGVPDPVLRRKLVPDYAIGCKRILISNDWYPALARPHVEVVTDGIARVVADGIVDRAGVHRPLDAILLGTGFAATEFLAPMRIRGQGGVLLDDAWKAGAKAYKGVSVAGFPNLFLLYGPNTNLAHNSIVYMLESQFAHVLRALRLVRERGLRWLAVKPDAEARYNAALQQRLADTVWTKGGCTSWYQTAEGTNTVNWPGFTFAYRRLLKRVEPADYEQGSIQS